MKHLIIEGCDGAGKTTLIDGLMSTGQYVAHARASGSLTGPVPSLDRWVEIDLDQIEELSEFEGMPAYLYDRHPLISELNYADLRSTNQGLKGKFRDYGWVAEQQRRMANLSILVICSPPYEQVERALQASGRQAHMPGVFENRYRLWKRYDEQVWPGKTIRYDWTRETAEDLLGTIKHMEN